MGGLVEPPGLEVEADRGRQARAHGALHLRGIGAVHERVVGPRPRGDLLRERHELVAQAVQQRLEPGDAHVGLVLVEQRVVALAALVADGVGLLAPQRDEALERIAEEREVGLGAGAPARPRSRPTRPSRARARARRGRARRGRARAAPRARARARSSPRLAVVAELGDRLAEALVADALVQHAGERRLGLTARRGAARRHVDLLVPVEQPADAAELADVALELLEDVPGAGLLRHRHQGLSGWWPWTASIMPISQPRPAIAKPQAKRLWIAALAREHEAEPREPDPGGAEEERPPDQRQDAEAGPEPVENAAERVQRPLALGQHALVEPELLWYVRHVSPRRFVQALMVPDRARTRLSCAPVRRHAGRCVAAGSSARCLGSA